jgi:cephalosporin hydroxylase
MTDNFKAFADQNKEFIANAIKDFNGIYYYSMVWQNTYWRGHKAFKFPTDMWIAQEIIWETHPNLIIETGVLYGGSTLFFGDMLELNGKGTVLAIEKNLGESVPVNPRITYIKGDSISPEVIEEVSGRIKPDSKVMVVLDSAHYKGHVLKEMEIYGKFVTPGCYMVVDDTCISGHPVRCWLSEEIEIAPGPYEAVMEYLGKHPEWEIDHRREKFLLTTNPRGYLRKKDG